MQFTTTRITVNTRYPFKIARPGGSVDGTSVHRIVVQCHHEGESGYGEAAPAPYYGESLESVERCIEQINSEPDLIGDNPFAVQSISNRLIDRFNKSLAAVSAIDCALHDWIGRRLGQPTWRLLGLSRNDTPSTSMTIGIDSHDQVVRKLREASAFRCLKIKVGTDDDIDTLKLIRNESPDASLRLDANASWPAEHALDHIHSISRFEPELIEQPIPAGENRAMQSIHLASPIPIYIDEDCIRPQDIMGFAGCVTGVNIKLAKCGGISQAVKMINLARAFGMKIMLGCMAETSLGIAAAMQIASLADIVDLDGHLLLRDDPFDGLILDGDRVLPNHKPGLGIDVSRWQDAK